MRVAIVGANETKWKEEQIPKVKLLIGAILRTGKKALTLPIPPFTFRSQGIEYSIAKAFTGELTLVSGHCPVGEERWYCITCNHWVTLPYGVSLHVGHNMVKVFDKGGVDTWAEIIATELGIKKEIYPAEVNQWNDAWFSYNTIHKDKHSEEYKRWKEHATRLKGYHSRNIQIAEAGLVKQCGDCESRAPIRMCIQSQSKSFSKIVKDADVCKKFVVKHDNYVLYDIEPAKSCEECNGTGIMYSWKFMTDEHMGFGECPFCEGDGAGGKGAGGDWTRKYARKLGREVHKIVIN